MEKVTAKAVLKAVTQSVGKATVSIFKGSVRGVGWLMGNPPPEFAGAAAPPNNEQNKSGVLT